MSQPQQRSESPTKKPPKVEPVKVVVRMRGLNQHEMGKPTKAGKKSRQSIASSRSWKVKDDKSCAQTTNTGESLPRKEGRTHFTYDRVFDEHASTREVFDESARDIVNSFVNGISGSLIAYGQTGSGKTFTMQGKRSLKDGAAQTEGVIHMTARTLFEELAKQQSSTFLIRVSAIEVYNEEIRDLLVSSHEHRKVSSRYDSKLGCIVESTEKFVNTYEEMIGVFSIADKNRIMKKTGMNDRSSRSHTMIKIILEKKDVCSVGGAYEIEFSEDESIQVSTLNLVDLAGSDTVIRNSEAQKEGSNINKSLLALSHVVAELGRSKKGFVNYRDSALTKVLQKDLKSQNKIAVICCITPSGLYTEQTRKTLEFGKYAIGVKTRPVRDAVKDNGSVIIKTLKHLNNARTGSRLSEEEKQEVEMKWQEIEQATFVAININASPYAKTIDDEETRSDEARSESMDLVDEELPSEQREDASGAQGTEENEDCDVSVVHSVAEQKMMEMEEEWNAMKNAMDERSLASGVESGSFVQSQSIPSEIELYSMDDDETTDFQLEAFNETDVINDHPDSPDEVDRTAFSSLAETEEDPESIKIDYVNDNTGRLGTHEDDISVLISCVSEESNLIQNDVWAYSRGIVTNLSMGTEITKDAYKYPGTVIIGASLDGDTSPGRRVSNGRGDLNDSMQALSGSEHDLLTYSEDSASIYSKNKPNYDDYVSECIKNGPTSDNACYQQEVNTPKVMTDSVRNMEETRSNSLASTGPEEELKANTTPFAIKKMTSNDQMVRRKDVDTDLIDTKTGNEEIIEALESENEHLRRDIIEITKKLDYESMQAEQLEENEHLTMKNNVDLELKLVSLAGKLQVRGEEIFSLTSKNADLELKVVSLSDKLKSRGDEISSLTSKNTDLEVNAVSLLDALQSPGGEIPALTSKVVNFEKVLLEKETQDNLLHTLSEKLKERNSQVSELSSRVKELEALLLDLKKVSNPQRTYLETTLLSISSQKRADIHVEDKAQSTIGRAEMALPSSKPHESEETTVEENTSPDNGEDDSDLISISSQESGKALVEDKAHADDEDDERGLISIKSGESEDIHEEDKRQSANDSEESNLEDTAYSGKDEDKKTLPSTNSHESEDTYAEDKRQSANDEEEWDPLSINSQESEEPSLQDSMEGNRKDCKVFIRRSVDDGNDKHSEFPDTSKTRVSKIERGSSLNDDENTMPSFDRGRSEATVNQQPCEPIFSKYEISETLLSKIDDTVKNIREASTGFGDLPDRDRQVKNGNGDGNITKITRGAKHDHESDRDEGDDSEEANNDENKENSNVLPLHFTRDDLAQTVGEFMLSPKKIASIKGEESMLKQWESLSTKFRYHRERVGDNED